MNLGGLKIIVLVAVVLAMAVPVAFADWARGLRKGPAQRPPQINRAALLDAIAAVETGNDPRKVGRRGERGRCQFMPEVWARYERRPFLLWAPVDCRETRAVERMHLECICSWLDARQYVLDPSLIAAAWRYGVHRAARCVRSDYAQRVANLYWEAVQ